MRTLLGTLFLFGAIAFVGCQQTQETDEPDDATVVKEKETVVQPTDQPEQTDVDVKVEGGEQEGASGEVKVGDEGASGEVEVKNP